MKLKTLILGLSNILILTCCLFQANAQETKKIMLSGKDFEHPKEWEFKVTGGQNSGKWSTINVPSQWELEGFGTYTYGRWYKELEQDEPSKEEGSYKYQFDAPKVYNGQRVIIKFGGVMTDTQVKVNGKLAGPKHQGGFYEFEYDITDLLKYDEENLLEVHVWKHSANPTVNNAERKADWWLFGGIYRPVWLEILPESHISHIAVDPEMDGSLRAEVLLSNIPGKAEIKVTLKAVGEEGSFKTFSFPVKRGTEKTNIETKWDNIKPWNPEDPHLYDLKLSLVKGKEVLHEFNQRIGFRTLDFRKKDGIYLNGEKIIMKGVNRHTIWPESGRSTSKRISIMDVNLIKDMNMNAVRFHYPPDDHFLEACDSLGLFVLDELAGWQNPYDTPTGKKLIKEMVQRDVNHPSIIIWDQGNEGGWNYELDSIFSEFDPQDRIVIHPWADFNGWDTHHYPTYLTGVHRFGNGENVFFPTEFMHGTYDNGSGSGLADFWEHYSQSPLFAGGFLWVFNDAAVRRSDWTGDQVYDSKGSLAPDGILGPHREKEGSFYTIKEVWAPIQFEPRQITHSFDGSFLITNKYIFTNLKKTELTYKIKKADAETFYTEDEIEVLYEGEIHVPDIQPGETRKIEIPVKENFFGGDWVEITGKDEHGREIYTWTWPIHKAPYYAEKFLHKEKDDKAEAKVETRENNVFLSGGEIEVTLNADSGEMIHIENSKNEIPFLNGPRPIGMKAEVEKVDTYMEGEDAVAVIHYNGGIHTIQWTMHPDGRLKMEMVALKNAGRNSGFDGAFYEGEIDKFGITFDFPEDEVSGIKWFGKGPYHVWKNRMQGTEYNIWEKDYNNTITGESFENLIYPEFKGYHANFLAGKILAGENTFRIFSESDKLFLRLFTPDEPKNAFPGAHPQPEFPEGNISFMYEIPAMRAFKPLSQQGPSSQPTNIRIKSGDDGIKMNLWFDFRNISE
ncbi:beta-galactosidase [Christiangramia fulva]|uniref:beta-galactosidase n=1 Tax=Christiangramia fulva TaxID=2126553 RepID=A0A2R3ZAZ8_9FLAO|nr:glycoside hydrolase family 2 TIM barrel-domain containing protein [Christiangramia fulva]AVR47420.1 beta-galactosidase [Christiangramia fulva]